MHDVTIRVSDSQWCIRSLVRTAAAGATYRIWNVPHKLTACCGVPERTPPYKTHGDVVALWGTFRALPGEHGNVRPCNSAGSRTQVPRACVPSVVVIDGVTAALPSGPLMIFRHFWESRSSEVFKMPKDLPSRGRFLTRVWVGYRTSGITC